ncbi:hypothetical protein SAMN05880593_106251 [Rhizobium sp. RU36D]|nr:hypothetical protein SAMN05880593_106251 [Rhizobium sp. RU36D]
MKLVSILCNECKASQSGRPTDSTSRAKCGSSSLRRRRKRLGILRGE